MKKETKMLLTVLGVILGVLVILYYLINIVYVPTPKPVDYPKGALSDSLFTAQNNKYQKNENLPQQHVFETVPYSVDVPAGDPAHIGTGTVYKASDTIFVYVSEYSDSDVTSTVDGIHEIIGTQFPAALLVDYIPEQTQIIKQVDQTGFINGFSAEYVVDSIKVSNSRETAEAVVLGYKLDMPSEVYKGIYAGKHIFVGMATNDITTENLANCDAMLSVIVGTVHYDDKYLPKGDKEKLDAMEEAEQQTEAATPMADYTSEDVSVVPDEGTTAESDITTLYVDVPTEYSLLTVDVTWSNPNPDVVLRLYTPDGTTWYEPADGTVTDTSARFNLSNAVMGMYSIEIEGYKACGAINTSQSGTMAVPVDGDAESVPERPTAASDDKADSGDVSVEE